MNYYSDIDQIFWKFRGEEWYQVLGVDKDASDEQIKTAYKKLAKQYHPDLSQDPNAVERWNQIQEAYNKAILNRYT